MGRVHLGLGELDESRNYLELAYELNGSNADILRSLMALDRRQGRMAESIARVEQAARENPENAKIQRLQGTVAMLSGNSEEAEAAFKKSIELDPEDLKGYEQLARFYANTGRLEETVKIYEQAIEVKPDEARLYHFLGVLYELGGDRDRAIAQYEEAIKRDANLAEAKNNLAFAFADKGVSLDRARDLAQEAKTQLPNNSSVADTLGWVLYRRGVPSAAISYLKEAEAGTDPGDANLGVVRHHLALAYEANGDTVLAREALNRALGELDDQIEMIRDRGGDPQGEPPWAVEARSMLKRLDSEG